MSRRRPFFLERYYYSVGITNDNWYWQRNYKWPWWLYYLFIIIDDDDDDIIDEKWWLLMTWPVLWMIGDEYWYWWRRYDKKEKVITALKCGQYSWHAAMKEKKRVGGGRWLKLAQCHVCPVCVTILNHYTKCLPQTPAIPHDMPIWQNNPNMYREGGLVTGTPPQLVFSEL